MKYSLLINICFVVLMGCSLNYEDTSAIKPDNVWTDKNMIDAFLTDIYGRMLPGWPVSANNTDEGMNNPADMSQYVRGQLTIDNCGYSLDYGNIDRINFFLEHIESADILSDEERNRLKGQALFWRAWDYWGKVFSVGGVPLILHTQNVDDIESLFVKRNSTSECVDQVLKDLNDAISLLPNIWEGDDYGRIDKGCAMAFKGRVLLQYASPLFNPDNDQKRWENAYKANKDAVDFLYSVGKGLYDGDFADIWYEEQNKEVIMVNQFYYPDHALNQASIRPEPLSKDASNQNQAILPLLMAFPKLTGDKLNLDLEKLKSDSDYNQRFMMDFFLDRDPRFYATVFCPGTEYPAKDVLVDGMKYWNAWRQVDTSLQGETSNYTSLTLDQLNLTVSGGLSGFFQKKGLSQVLTKQTIDQAEVDWIEIRFAEVLMNYGECANEIGKTAEALQVLYDIRKRAGIRSVDGKYGITGVGKEGIRQAYIDERLIEFAYEGKRWADLRRWKRYDILNNLKYRSVLYPVIKDYEVVKNGDFDWKQTIFNEEVLKLFRLDYIECVDGDRQFMFNLDLNHWFYPIAKNDLDRNSKLEQNSEWGGGFDPLK